VRSQVASFRQAFGGRVSVHYAVKANPLPQIIDAVGQAGGKVEVASQKELHTVLHHGAKASEVIYTNPVKPIEMIAEAYRLGVRQFVADGVEELDKLQRYAPGSEVIVRVKVHDDSSAFPFSAKFGAPPDQVFGLMQEALRRGLRPVGMSFHVGSQCTDKNAWGNAVESLAPIIAQMKQAGMPLDVLDIGGGFPVAYDRPVPGFEEIAQATLAAVDRLPLQPKTLVAEPGRAMVARSTAVGATVIGTEERDGKRWVFLDVGGYQAFSESMQKPGGWPFPMRTAATDAAQVATTVTGPTCDSGDTITQNAVLPADLKIGDHVYIGMAGAYTVSVGSPFNGIEPPKPVIVG
jgi:ornithine decarboxylase